MHWFHIRKHIHVQLNLLVIYVTKDLGKSGIYKDILELIVVINTYYYYYNLMSTLIFLKFYREKYFELSNVYERVHT